MAGNRKGTLQPLDRSKELEDIKAEEKKLKNTMSGPPINLVETLSPNAQEAQNVIQKGTVKNRVEKLQPDTSVNTSKNVANNINNVAADIVSNATKSAMNNVSSNAKQEKSEAAVKNVATSFVDGLVNQGTTKVANNINNVAADTVSNAVKGAMNNVINKRQEARKTAAKDGAATFMEGVIAGVANSRTQSGPSSNNTVVQDQPVIDPQGQQQSLGESVVPQEVQSGISNIIDQNSENDINLDLDTIDVTGSNFELGQVNDNETPLSEAMRQSVEKTEKNEPETPLTQQEKTTLSDFFKGIGTKLNEFTEGIGKKFTELSEKITGSENLTFSDISKDLEQTADDTNKNVTKSNLDSDTKNRITGAVSGLNERFKNNLNFENLLEGLKKAAPTIQFKQTPRDKVLSNIVKNITASFGDMMSGKTKPEQTLNQDQKTRLSEIMTALGKGLPTSNDVMNTIQNISEGIEREINSFVAGPHDIEGAEKKALQESRKNRIDATLDTIPEKSGENIKQGLEGMEQVGLKPPQIAPKIAKQDSQVVSNPLHNKTKKVEPSVQENVKTNSMGTEQRNLGNLNPSALENMDFPKGIRQSRENDPIGDLQEQLNRIEDKVDQKEQPKQPEKQGMSDGMKAALVVGFLLLFLFNPALAISVGVIVGGAIATSHGFSQLAKENGNKQQKPEDHDPKEKKGLQRFFNGKEKEHQREGSKDVKPPSTPNITSNDKGQSI